MHFVSKITKTSLSACLLFVACAQHVHAQDSILVGQSAPLTGPTQALGQETKAGIEAYFNLVNAKGGVNGKKLVLKSLDDGNNAEKTMANTAELIDKDNVIALLGYVGAPAGHSVLHLLTKGKVPLMGPLTGAQSLREPYNRYVFHVRASDYDEAEAIVDHLVRSGATRIAAFYQNDAYGLAGWDGIQRALKRRNMAPSGNASVERGHLDVKPAAERLAKGNHQVVVIIAAPKMSAAFTREMRRLDASTQYWNLSLVGSKSLADELAQDGRGVQISQVVPYPWGSSPPVVKEYQKAISPNNQESQYGFASLEGYLAAKILVEGLKRAGKAPTREKLVDALDNMGKVDVGGFTVYYSPGNHLGSQFVDLTMISKNGKFMR
jgi:branched-chain amino acid transport system substrate-binding protein